MDFALLVAYVGLPILAFARTRSLAWTVIAVAVAVSFGGAIVSLTIDLGFAWSRLSLQLMLLAVLVVVAVIAFVFPPQRAAPVRWQLVAIVLPAALLLAFYFILMTFWTDEGAFHTPVGFLIGHSVAEDNAKWLDVAAQIAAGGPIAQQVPMGGPLQLFLAFMATTTGAVSRVVLGGYNEVAVAANAVVLGQFFLAIIGPLALAPLAEARLRSAHDGARVRIPVPFLWVSGLVLVAGLLGATAYGHMTFQYVVLLAALWSTTFLARLPLRQAPVLLTLSMAIAMVVWLPLNVLAMVILIVTPIGLAFRGIAGRQWNWIGIGAWIVALASLFEPIRSSLLYALGLPTAAGATIGGGAIRGVTAAAGVAASTWAGLAESPLFTASGGTDQVGPIMAILAGVAALGATIVVARQPGVRRSGYWRLVPLAVLVGMALAITLLDFWVTGAGPHYGSLKFTYMAAIVTLASSLPLALMLLDPRASSAMTAVRWVGVGGIVVLLTIDTLFPRAVAASRPQQWSPAIPFENPASYWWPAEVNGTGEQPIAKNPIGCVYLPRGATVPSVVMLDENNQLQNPQRVYACTRLLMGLAGVDSPGVAMVDWQRREWGTNQHAWEQEWTNLAAMAPEVLDKPVILLDAGMNITGMESMRSLLDRFPQYAGSAPPTTETTTQ